MGTRLKNSVATNNSCLPISEKKMTELTDFLITNMQSHFGVEGKEYQKFYSYFKEWDNHECKASVISDSIIKTDGKFSLSALLHIPDWKRMKADSLWNYIIEILEFRNQARWCAEIPWSQYMEHVAPYRVSNEPLVMGWRKAVLEYISPVTDSLIKTKCSHPLIAAQSIIQYWNRKPFKWTDCFPQGASLGSNGIFLKNGSCRNFAEALVLLMRASGIPSGIDLMLVRGDCNSSHSWPYINTEKSLTYIATTENPSWNLTHSLRIPATKVYRLLFSETELLGKTLFYGMSEKDFHPWFRNNHLKDVTSLYYDVSDIEIILDNDIKTDTPVYLCNTMRNMWVPTAIGKASEGKAVFKDIAASSAACIVAKWNGHSMIPLSPPFIIGNKGNLRFIITGKPSIKATLFCKFPLSERNGDVVDRMIGGLVEASNDSDFKNVETIYQIINSPIRKINRVNVYPSKPYRFIRYRGADSTYCNIAELEIYSTNGNNIALGKRIFGTKGDRDGKGSHEYYNVFDGNLDTSFDYKFPSGGWSAVDLGLPHKITGLAYSPRNRDNYIREGDVYELFYWDTGKHQWVTLGKKEASSDELTYNIPIGSLLFLKNHTQGIDERVFEYDIDSKLQVFH